jgi:hypothetical protein
MKKKNAKYILMLVTGLCLYQQLNAQVAVYNPVFNDKLHIMGVPQMLFMHGLRIDLDVPRKEGKEWLIISPELFYKDKYDDMFSPDYDEMIGGRLGLAQRIYFSNNNHLSNWYLSLGVNVEYVQLSRMTDAWVNYTSDGIVYSEPGVTDIKSTSFRPGLEFIIGKTVDISDHLLLDWFVGTGFRYCFFDGTSEEKAHYSDGMYGRTHSGAVLLGGFRFGLSLPKKYGYLSE